MCWRSNIGDPSPTARTVYGAVGDVLALEEVLAAVSRVQVVVACGADAAKAHIKGRT
jgi:hypothetical protein